MSSRQVVHVFSVIPRLSELVQKKLPDVDVKSISPPGRSVDKYGMQVKEENINLLKKCEILLIDNHLLVQVADHVPNVKWAQGTWAGVERLAEYFKTNPHPKFPVTRMSGENFRQLMAEYVVGWIINHERDFLGARNYQLKSEWANRDKVASYRSLRELTVGVLGVGAIGTEVAKTLKGFHCCVHGLGRSLPPTDLSSLHLDYYWQPNNLKMLLENCDYIINVLPSTPETKGLLATPVLQSAKKNAVLINIGRGDLLSEDDVIDALDNGWLSSAILDVYNVEPLPKTSKLWLHPKVILTPHCAGITQPEDAANAFVENWSRYQKSLPLLHEVNWAIGY